MSTIAREPARAAPERRHWSAQILVREMWASLAIAAMWLAVLFAAVFAPDFVSSDAGGNTTRILVGRRRTVRRDRHPDAREVRFRPPGG